jgi:hypothetical protein
MYPHKMRLRRPWQRELLTSPADHVRFRRHFGYPGRIDHHERVWLTFADVPATAQITLNSHNLGTRPPPDFEFDVTQLLRDRNVLEIVMKHEPATENAWGEVSLEIRCTAYLKNIRTSRDQDRRLHVAGSVEGHSDRILDVYAVVARQNVGYGTVEAGKSFDLALEEPPTTESDTTLRVELVYVSQVWYAVEVPWA